VSRLFIKKILAASVEEILPAKTKGSVAVEEWITKTKPV
jgi:hypothetical protein